VAVRPERIAIEAADHTGAAAGASLTGLLVETLYLGATVQYIAALAEGTRVTVRRPAGTGAPAIAPGTPVALRWSPLDAVVLLA
jgi:hypothetical protein